MSDDGQQFSIRNQQAAIEEYAKQHDFVVVRTYEDAGKSGLALKDRAGLRQLIQDVISGKPNYKAIRWHFDKVNCFHRPCRHLCKNAAPSAIFPYALLPAHSPSRTPLNAIDPSRKSGRIALERYAKPTARPPLLIASPTLTRRRVRHSPPQYCLAYQTEDFHISALLRLSTSWKNERVSSHFWRQ